jgi:diguanylate cyclase (GGDEF)-like protein
VSVTSLPALCASTDFNTACQEVLDYLSNVVPMGYWSVSRYDGTDQLYLAVRDTAYGKVAGDRHAWSDSFCQYATTGEAPQIAPDAMSVPQYAAAGVSQELPIGSYIGIPLRRADGELFGTICGLDPSIKPAELESHAPLLDLLARLLGMILEADSARAAQARALEQAEARAETDHLTGAVNRRGWERYLALEQERYRRFGDPGSVIVVDLDGLKTINDTQGHSAGDRYLQTAATVLQAATRSTDLVARLGGDEFGVLAAAATAAQTENLLTRLRRALEDAGVACSMGYAPYSFGGGLRGAWRAADAAMYADKQQRRSLARLW